MRRVILSTTCCMLVCFNALIAQIPKGDRVLSYSVSNSEDQLYEDAFAFAVENCMELNHLQFPWGQYETDLDTWNAESMVLMDITNLFYPAFDMTLELNIGTMNTTVNDIPDDLVNLNYDNPIVIERFKAFLDTMFNRIPDVRIEVLSIGNESDLFMGIDESQYTEYKVFLDEVVPYAKQKYFDLHAEELQVATTLTHESLTSPILSELCANLNEGLDVINATYYPLLPGFQMDDPNAVIEAFEDLVAQYNDSSQPIYYVECGYASSPICGSSEEAQAEFYEYVFEAWDEQIDRIKSVSIFKMSDWSQAEVDEFGEYYGIDDEAFLEYLRTLGIRSYDGLGEDKPAVQTIQCELDQRDWCETVSCTSSTLDQERIEEFEIYPNPARNWISIKGEIDPGSSLQIIDLKGTIIQEEVISEDQSNIALKDLPIGYYVIKVGDRKAVPLVIE